MRQFVECLLNSLYFKKPIYVELLKNPYRFSEFFFVISKIDLSNNEL